jgi:hypothetical protein
MQNPSLPTGRPADAEPYLSVVVTARNDDHGGNPLYRMQLFLDGLIAQCDRHRLPTELVLVEWNPPDDRPRLADVLHWPAGDSYCTVRIIEVPGELHFQLEHSDRLPLFQMIAKNVGIRRARGEFVLATNIDILLSDGLMRFLSERRLRDGFLYRADRSDVPAEIDPAWPIERQLSWCKESTMRINRREGTLDLRDGVFYRIGPPFALMAWLRNSGSGRRLLDSTVGRAVGLRRLAYSRPIPHRGLRGRLQDSLFVHWVSNEFLWRVIMSVAAMVRYVGFRVYAFVYWVVAGFNEPQLVPSRIRKRLRRIAGGVFGTAPGSSDEASTGLSARLRAFLFLFVALGRQFTQLVRRKARSLVVVWKADRARLPLHTNASGDFTLMSREDWDKTRGYVEFEMYSMHIDGLQLYTAHYLRIRERFLPFPIYHIEHGGGFRPEAKGEDALDTTLARSAIPQITNDQLSEYIVEMYRARAPLPLAKADWGFAQIDLPETHPMSERDAAITRVAQR